MIVNWTKSRVKVIPCIDPITRIQVGKVTLLPGMQEVKDKDWELARLNVEDEIKRKDIIEVHGKSQIIKEEVPDPKDKEKKIEKRKVEIKSKPLKDLEPAQAIKVVKETFNLSTLGRWKNTVKSESVRHAINQQIDKIKEYGEKAKDVKDEEDSEGGDE